MLGGMAATIALAAMAASRAQLAFDQLQSNYWQPHIGFWSSSMWWQTANTIETLCNFAELPGAPKATITELLPVVFVTSVAHQRWNSRLCFHRSWRSLSD